MFTQPVEDFCACTKLFDICQRTEHTQRGRSLNKMRMVCASAVRQGLVTERNSNRLVDATTTDRYLNGSISGLVYASRSPELSD